mgnify:FL=1|tara:strand:+ start:4682 stop:4954 length:273 start_codon:yes stop_codon:yes gene_type:complete
MAIENVQQLLTEQLGKNGSTEVFTGGVTGKDFYCVYFPVESVVSAITAADATGESSLQTTLPAGTTLFMNITAITLTQGVAIGYNEGATT